MEGSPLVAGLVPEWIYNLQETLNTGSYAGIRLKDRHGAWCVECTTKNTTFDNLLHCYMAVRVMGFSPAREDVDLYTVRHS